MMRRAFITLLGGAGVAWPLMARAQQPAMPVIGGLVRVGLIIGTSPEDAESKRRRTNFERKLQGLGWTDGRNVDFAYRWVESGIERFRAAAAELVELQPDVIVVAGTQAATAVLRATRYGNRRLSARAVLPSSPVPARDPPICDNAWGVPRPTPSIWPVEGAERACHMRPGHRHGGICHGRAR
jgi:hypothetical protein